MSWLRFLVRQIKARDNEHMIHLNSGGRVTLKPALSGGITMFTTAPPRADGVVLHVANVLTVAEANEVAAALRATAEEA